MTEDWLATRDAARLARYRECLDFYEGRQWLGRPLPQERRLMGTTQRLPNSGLVPVNAGSSGMPAVMT